LATVLKPSAFDLILARITQDVCSAAHGLSNLSEGFLYDAKFSSFGTRAGSTGPDAHGTAHPRFSRGAAARRRYSARVCRYLLSQAIGPAGRARSAAPRSVGERHH